MISHLTLRYRHFSVVVSNHLGVLSIAPHRRDLGDSRMVKSGLKAARGRINHDPGSTFEPNLSVFDAIGSNFGSL